MSRAPWIGTGFDGAEMRRKCTAWRTGSEVSRLCGIICGPGGTVSDLVSGIGFSLLSSVAGFWLSKVSGPGVPLRTGGTLAAPELGTAVASPGPQHGLGAAIVLTAGEPYVTLGPQGLHAGELTHGVHGFE